MFKKILLSILFFLPFFLFAQTEYTFITHRGVVKDGYNFWLSVPDTYEAQQEKMPVVLFLHGASLCGSDLNRVRRYGCLHAISMGRDIDALVVAPQNPGGAWNPKRIMAVLNWVKEHYALDTNRLYVLGMSLGGYGTFDFTATYPDKIAASMALCGGSSRKDFCGLNRVPLWIIHGTADYDVPLSRSQVIVDAMKACGPTDLLRFDKFKGVNHSQPAKIFYLNETYQWLFSHSLADSVRKVNKDISITVADLGHAYDGINRSANKIVVKDSKYNITPMVPQTAKDSLSRDSVSVSTKTTVEQTAATQSATTTNPAYHIVKKGDTLYAIARRYHTTVEKLCKINHIKETGILSLGQKIKLR